MGAERDRFCPYRTWCAGNECQMWVEEIQDCGLKSTTPLEFAKRKFSSALKADCSRISVPEHLEPGEVVYVPPEWRPGDKCKDCDAECHKCHPLDLTGKK